MNNTSAALKWFWHHVHFGGGLAARLRPPRDRAAQSVTSLTLTFVYWWQVAVERFLCGFCVEGRFRLYRKNPWVTTKKLLQDNCLTVKWWARVSSETSTRRCINHCVSQYVLNQQVCLPWKKTPFQALHFYIYSLRCRLSSSRAINTASLFIGLEALR